IRAGLVVPLLLIAVLAGAMGFVLGRSVYPRQSVARVSTVATNASLPTSTPATPAPTTSAAPASSSGSGSHTDSSCPAGCECQHPSGGIVVVCHGGNAVRIP